MSTTAMEVDGTTQRGKKRGAELYDPDDQNALSSAKKLRAEPEEEKKMKCLKFMLYAYELIHAIASVTAIDPEFENINVACAIMNCIFSVFNMLRQETNGLTGNAKKKSEATKFYTITSKSKQVALAVEDITKLVKEAATKAGLEFKKFGLNDKENWYGTAAPFLCFFTAFNMRLKEIRVGNSTMPFTKENGIAKSFPVSKYGLNESHHILLEGCSYPPEKRSAMAQTLGPMTSLLLHIRTEEKYRKKWTDAAKKAMSHVPFIDEILEVVKGRKASEVAGLLSTVADILRIASSRQANRMFFPINFLYRAYKLSVEANTDKIVDDKGTVTNMLGGDTLLKNFTVSGAGGYYLYKLVTKMSFELEGDFTKEQAQQITFHAIFGTYKEDLTVLEQITAAANWFTREELGPCFKKMTTCGKSIKFNPVRLDLYSKLSNANQTGMLTSNYGQTSSLPVFSGNRRQRFTEDFFEQLSKKTTGTSVSKNIPQLTAALTKTLLELQEELERSNRTWEMGTVEWRSMTDLNASTPGTVINKIVEAQGKFFLGRNSH